MGEDSSNTPPEPGTPEPAPAPEATAPTELPNDHPLVTAYERVKAELTGARSTLQSIEEEKKTDGEKLTDRLTAAEEKARTAEQKALRLEVASAKGLTVKQAQRLVGSSVEELEADADDLLASFTPALDDRPAREGNPTTRLRGGSDPTEEPEERDPDKLASFIPRP